MQNHFTFHGMRPKSVNSAYITSHNNKLLINAHEQIIDLYFRLRDTENYQCLKYAITCLSGHVNDGIGVSPSDAYGANLSAPNLFKVTPQKGPNGGLQKIE